MAFSYYFYKMKIEKNKTKLIIGALILVITILLIFVVYAFAIKPAITSYVIEAKNQGANEIVSIIMDRASQCQQVPLTFGDQTMNIVWVECLNRALESQTPLQ